jgi:hypothetical protein
MYRVLKPGGLLFLAFHLGDEVLHEENCWGRRISLDLVLFGRKEVERYLADAGFAIEDSLDRRKQRVRTRACSQATVRGWWLPRWVSSQPLAEVRAATSDLLTMLSNGALTAPAIVRYSFKDFQEAVRLADGEAGQQKGLAGLLRKGTITGGASWRSSRTRP